MLLLLLLYGVAFCLYDRMKNTEIQSQDMVDGSDVYAVNANDVHMIDAGDHNNGNDAGDNNNNNKIDSNGTPASVHRQPEPDTPLPLKKHSSSRGKHDSPSRSKGAGTGAETAEVDEAGTVEEQLEFMKELETFHMENNLDFKPPKFYGDPLNCLKLWRAVIKLGGYEAVTASKLWRQIGESFHPPKTCTTVSWTFRIFYEKALLDYEKHKIQNGELQLPGPPLQQPVSVEKEVIGYPPSGSGRTRRDAAARAMLAWNEQRLFGYAELGESVIKDRSSNPGSRRGKPLKSTGKQKIKVELPEKPAVVETDKKSGVEIVDVGQPADWVKINVQETNDCFEVYALVPGLLREEVRVQSDGAGRLVITGYPEQVDNPWGITPFKKDIRLPKRIDPVQTSAVFSLHGRLYVHVPFQGAGTA